MPPTIASAAPTGTMVALAATLVVTFSEPMDVGSVSLTLMPSVSLGDESWSDGNRKVTVAPGQPLRPGTLYTVAVAGKDTAGNDLGGLKTFSFTTIAVRDTTAPTVVSTTPASGAMAVPPNTGIAFEFSEPMNRASVQGAFTCVPAVTCAWQWSADSTLAQCDPATDFPAGAAVTATMGAGAADVAGNRLVAQTLRFSVASAPDTAAPTIVSALPMNNAIGALPTVAMVVVFSEPMNRAATQAAFSIVAPAGIDVTFTWNAAGTSMTVRPTAPLAYGTQIIWRVSTGARDLAGNVLGAVLTSVFRVLRQIGYNAPAIATLDGSVSTFDGSPGTPATTTKAVDVGTGFLAGGRGTVYTTGFFTFDLSAVPSTFTQVTGATLYVSQVGVVGDPFQGGRGQVYVESVDYGPSLDASDLNLPVLHPAVVLSTDATTGFKSCSVLAAFRSDWESRMQRGSRSQFRVRMVGGTSGWASLATGDDDASPPRRPYLRISGIAP